jgi:hypothetical protein
VSPSTVGRLRLALRLHEIHGAKKILVAHQGGGGGAEQEIDLVLLGQALQWNCAGGAHQNGV